MKTHTTNYFNTLIQPAEDCPVSQSEIPVVKTDKETIATMQFELIGKHPYQFTSDDVIFSCYAQKNDLTSGELKEAREQFFSKGQPCLRTSPLSKRYGFGIHSDEKGKVALVPMESAEYQKFASDTTIDKVRAMRSKRA